jgi:DNA-binding Xre family transcriptional regulator
MRLRPVKELAEKVGIKNASHLRSKTGLGVGTCYQLWEGTATRFDLTTLNTLCNVLQIGPAFLFDYTPDVEPQSQQGAEEAHGSRSRPPRKPVKVRGPKSATQRTAAVAVAL